MVEHVGLSEFSQGDGETGRFSDKSSSPSPRLPVQSRTKERGPEGIALGAPFETLTPRWGELPDQKSPWPCPAWPPPPPFLSSFGRSATRHSVVSMRPATLAAFCSAVRTTFTGSMPPIAKRGPYWSLF